ncbi:hypothetical protein F4824DRAFT_479509 [Ustulina deusta]|nr:hypothetical protein F4824DRAFT_479509 [Ustulina deusta]
MCAGESLYLLSITSFSPAALGVANREFEQEFREKQSHQPIEEILKPLTVEMRLERTL